MSISLEKLGKKKSTKIPLWVTFPSLEPEPTGACGTEHTKWAMMPAQKLTDPQRVVRLLFKRDMGIYANNLWSHNLTHKNRQRM